MNDETYLQQSKASFTSSTIYPQYHLHIIINLNVKIIPSYLSVSINTRIFN